MHLSKARGDLDGGGAFSSLEARSPEVPKASRARVAIRVAGVRELQEVLDVLAVALRPELAAPPRPRRRGRHRPVPGGLTHGGPEARTHGFALRGSG